MQPQSAPTLHSNTEGSLRSLLEQQHNSYSEDDCFFYLFGYFITKVGDNSCLVTVVSQIHEQRFDIDHFFCRKLKLFIEELTLFTDNESIPIESNMKRLFSAEADVRVKLNSYIGAAAEFMLKRRTRKK